MAKLALSMAGYRVMIAHDGEEAISIFAARSDDIDLVLLALSRPVMGGEHDERKRSIA